MSSRVSVRSLSLLVALSVSAAIAIACGSSETVVHTEVTPEPISSFYLEIRIEVDADESVDPFPPDGPVTSEMRWWFEEPGRFRRETVTSDPPHLSGSSLIISDGSRWTWYDESLNRFQANDAVQAPPGSVPAPPSSFLIGPIQGGSVEAWAESVKTANSRFGLKQAGTDEMLGRTVELFEFSNDGIYLETEGTVATGATGRIWFDRNSGFVLKYEGPDSDRIVAEVTELDLNPDIDDERFVFRAPPGAVEAERWDSPITLSGSVGQGGSPDTPPGMMGINYVPPGFTSGSSSTGASMNVVNRALNMWTDSNGRGLRVRQFVRSQGLPEAHKSDLLLQSSVLTERSYHLHESDDGNVISLARQDGNLSIIVDGVGVSRDELLRVANSMSRDGSDPSQNPEG